MSTDHDKPAAALARYRDPELHLHPDDFARVSDALRPRDLKRNGLASPTLPLVSIPVYADVTVPRGQMRVMERLPPAALMPMEIETR